jgi:ferritin-like metal-binding protein YciE
MPISNSLHGLFKDQLQRLYGAARTTHNTLTRMAAACASPHLREHFEASAALATAHAHRIEQVFQKMNTDCQSKDCAVSHALVGRCDDATSEHLQPRVRDAAMAAAAQGVYAYMVACYAIAYAWAGVLSRDQAGALLRDSLDELSASSAGLDRLAATINPGALPYVTA